MIRHFDPNGPVDHPAPQREYPVARSLTLTADVAREARSPDAFFTCKFEQHSRLHEVLRGYGPSQQVAEQHLIKQAQQLAQEILRAFPLPATARGPITG